MNSVSFPTFWQGCAGSASVDNVKPLKKRRRDEKPDEESPCLCSQTFWVMNSVSFPTFWQGCDETAHQLNSTWAMNIRMPER
ncbi:hypothetical protein E4U21_003953 [Claviceps maximensis]|nr:hypothetical protein E4U21_003953 [Claviceps maximensis]